MCTCTKQVAVGKRTVKSTVDDEKVPEGPPVKKRPASAEEKKAAAEAKKQENAKLKLEAEAKQREEIAQLHAAQLEQTNKAMNSALKKVQTLKMEVSHRKPAAGLPARGREYI